jgi:superfamily II DNA or RNA helicase
MQIIDNKALLLRVKRPEHILSSLDNARLVGDNDVLVKWDLEQAKRLRGMGYKVPSPIEGRYNWPGKFKPMGHQKTTAAFFTLNDKSFCFSEQGTGKTASAIWAADYLMTIGAVRRVLVICPVSIMDVAWRADLFSFAMHRTVGIAHGTAEKRRKVLAQNTEFVIINFDGVEVIQKELAAGKFDLVIADECSAVKNAMSKRWKVLRNLLRELGDPRLWMMTGTPAAQGPEDAYGIAKLVNPGGVPRTFGAFKDSVMIKVSQFKWEPRPESHEIVHRALQPAIRFTKEECLDLPDMVYVKREVELTRQQKKYYDLLRKEMLMEAAGSVVTAVNAAVQMGKLLQVACISEDTPVLCARGWVPIQDVTAQDLIWDGAEWVICDGAILKGTKQTLTLDGVKMTEDHLVLSTSGWKTAKECIHGNAGIGFERAGVRLPDSFGTPWDKYGASQEGYMAMPVHLRADCGARVSEPALKAQAEREALWVYGRKVERNPRHVPKSTFRRMVTYAQALQQSARQGFSKLRGAWDNCMCSLERVVQSILGRHGPILSRWSDLGQNRQQRALQPGELPLGHREAAGAEHAVQRMVGHTQGPNDLDGSIRKDWDKESDVTCEAFPWLAPRQSTCALETQVYDVLNSGPRNRFVVRGARGELLIVHNCGCVYDTEGNTLEFDIRHRYSVLEEAIAEAAKKVLVFVPYTHVIDVLYEKLTADGYSVDIIRGDVPVSKRTDIFNRFQREKNPHILLIQPQAAAHGVTLTAADTVVWWAPVSSLEIYAQANARVHRKGQTHKCTAVQLQGSPVERKLYAMLDRRVEVNTRLVDLYKEVLD